MKRIFTSLFSLLLVVASFAQGPKLLGLTSAGGSNDEGVLFSISPENVDFNQAMDFQSASSGSNPYGSLMLANNNKLYGMTRNGGANDKGVLFQCDTNGTAYTVLMDFDGDNGRTPQGNLIQASNGKLYGMATRGGLHDKGVLFEWDIQTGTYTKKMDFDGDNGALPYGSLLEASNGKLMAMTERGGLNDKGVVFEWDPSTELYFKHLDFNGIETGAFPRGNLIQACNGKLYGMTKDGGVNCAGVLFEMDLLCEAYVKKHDFSSASGKYPYGSLVQASNGLIYGLTSRGGSNDEGVLFEWDTDFDIYTTKMDFESAVSGANPRGSLMEASNGKLYAMTRYGGASDVGTIFEWDYETDTYSNLLEFNGTNGAQPRYTHFVEVTPSEYIYEYYTVETCSYYYDPSCGQTFYESCTYADTIENDCGKDRIIIVDVIVRDAGDMGTSCDGYTICAMNPNADAYQWIRCSDKSEIKGATQPCYTPTEVGEYAVVIYANNCSDTSSCTMVNSLLNIDGESNIPTLEVYPNPSNGSFNINTNMVGANLQVFGLDGKLVYEQQKLSDVNQEINLDVNPGMYFLKLIEGEREKMIKITVER